jgi:hypothetical protein
MRFLSFLVLLVVFSVNSKITFGQNYDGLKGYGVYQKYDKSYISPDLKAKHSVSLGFSGGLLSPHYDDLKPAPGAHVGYNYIIYKKRKRLFGIKEVERDEIKMGFGAHLTVFSTKEWYFNVNYLNPLISKRGKLLSFYFINEFGLGLHSSPPKLEAETEIDFNMSLEFMRIRFGKSPLNLCFTAHFDPKGSFFEKQRVELDGIVSLRYYIQKK